MGDEYSLNRIGGLHVNHSGINSNRCLSRASLIILVYRQRQRGAQREPIIPIIVLRTTEGLVVSFGVKSIAIWRVVFFMHFLVFMHFLALHLRRLPVSRPRSSYRPPKEVGDVETVVGLFVTQPFAQTAPMHHGVGLAVEYFYEGVSISADPVAVRAALARVT